jgi:hypothetical protein
MVFLMLGSVWMNSPRRVDGFLRVYLWGALFAALYGLRQFVFGLAPFELERISMFGSIASEIEKLGRTRIPSSFGDPATFAFVMMSGVLLLPIIRFRPILPPVIRRCYLLVLGLFLFGLLMSLVRGPLVACAVAVAFLFVIQQGRVLTRIVQLLGMAIVAVILFFLLNYAVINGIFVQSDNELLKAVDRILTSVWTAVPLPVDLESLTWQQRSLRTLSVETRQSGWQQAITFLLENPWGGGIGAMTEGRRELGFSVGDVGFMRFGMELGWFGLFAFLGLFFSIPWVAYRKLRLISDKSTVVLGYQLLALWVGYFVASQGAPYLYTEILSAAVWTVAGILLNLDIIAKVSSQ